MARIHGKETGGLYYLFLVVESLREELTKKQIVFVLFLSFLFPDLESI